MGVRYASTKFALGACDVCGFRYGLSELRTVIRKGRGTSIKACPTCWDPDHPQLRLGEYKIDDPQALRDARPDASQISASRAVITPVTGNIAYVRVGKVTVQI